MRQINVTLDIYSGILCLMLLLYLVLNGKIREKLNLYFILMCTFNLGMLLGDLTNWTCEGGSHAWFPFLLRFGTVLYFGCSAPLLLSFAGYILTYLSPGVAVRRGVWGGAGVLTAIQLGMSVCSLWTGSYYFISADNIYCRGNLFWLSQLIPILILTIAVAIILLYRKQLRRKDVLFLLSYAALPLIAEVIQMLYYGIALMNTGSMLALLLIFINIQLEQELRVKEQEKALTDARVDIMMSQIQPHFLYNTLTSIRKLCDLDPEQAKQAIGDFAYFLRANMNSLTNKSPIPFEQELEHVRHYLNLEQQRFQERLHVVCDITVRNFFIPPLTLQPIVENAVRHGVIKREAGGTVTIRTEETERAYRVMVMDDGPGFPVVPEKESGLGIENVRKRLASLCGGGLAIESVPEKETTVILSIPKKGEGRCDF